MVFPYLISYVNAGTTTLSPNIVFNFDNTKLVYDSSTAPVVVNSHSLSLPGGNFVAGQTGSFYCLFQASVNCFLPGYFSCRCNDQRQWKKL